MHVDGSAALDIGMHVNIVPEESKGMELGAKLQMSPPVQEELGSVTALLLVRQKRLEPLHLAQLPVQLALVALQHGQLLFRDHLEFGQRALVQILNDLLDVRAVALDKLGARGDRGQLVFNGVLPGLEDRVAGMGGFQDGRVGLGYGHEFVAAGFATRVMADHLAMHANGDMAGGAEKLDSLVWMLSTIAKPFDTLADRSSDMSTGQLVGVQAAITGPAQVCSIGRTVNRGHLFLTIVAVGFLTPPGNF